MSSLYHYINYHFSYQYHYFTYLEMFLKLFVPGLGINSYDLDEAIKSALKICPNIFSILVIYWLPKTCYCVIYYCTRTYSYRSGTHRKFISNLLPANGIKWLLLLISVGWKIWWCLITTRVCRPIPTNVV